MPECCSEQDVFQPRSSGLLLPVVNYELEINQVKHSNGGIMRRIIYPNKIVIVAKDTGPALPI